MCSLFSPTLFPALLVTLVCGPLPAGDEDLPDSTGSSLFQMYGFSGLNISKLNDGVSNLTCADVDGDGKNDLLVINNARSKIEFLLQGEVKPEESDPALANELPDEVTFRREAYPTEEKVTSIAVADLDGDGNNDLAFLGDSGKVTVAYRDDQGKYARTERFEVEEHSGSGDALQPADLDGDGRLDLAVLGRKVTWLLLQDGEGRLSIEKKLANATPDAGSFRVVDLDGEGTRDLLYVEYQSEWPFRYRLGEGGLAFGPEIRSRFAEIRSFEVADVDGQPGMEILAVRRKSGRLALFRFGGQAPDETAAMALSSLRSVPFEDRKNSEQRESVLHDLDGDGEQELLVTEPASAQVMVYRGLLGGPRSGGRSYPTYVGASHPRLGDLDGDGVDELVIAAPEEGAIGVSAIDAAGDLGFPDAMAIPDGDDLLALDLADTDADGVDEIWLVLGSGKGRSRKHRMVQLAAGGEVVSEFALGKRKADPNDLMLVDLNRDGRLDAMVFEAREVPAIWLARGDGSGFDDLKADAVPTLGILKGTERRSMAFGDVDGDGQDELLVPGPNFARAFTLGEDGVPRVVAQFNLDDTVAEVSRVALGDLSGTGGRSILLVDKSSSTLRVLKVAKGSHEQVARVDLGGLQPEALVLADLDQNGAVDVLATATDRFSVIQNGGFDPVFEAVDDLEIPIKDAYLDRIALGDVNADGGVDVVLTESGRHLLAIAAIHAARPDHPDQLEYALKFPVYEERLFERGGRGGREPREILIGEVTGDGRPDIAILVHDRLIVYPQE